MDEKQTKVVLNDAQLEDISGGALFLNGVPKVVGNLLQQNAESKTCKMYNAGNNNHTGNRVMNTCSSCANLTMDSREIFCSRQNPGKALV